MQEKKQLTCIGCPMSCPLELTIVNGEISEITGYSCKKGEEYARQEYTAPVRMVSTTIACASGLWPRLPVKTVEGVPKGQVMAVVQELHALEIAAPVQVGQVILDDVAATGIAVVSTRSLPVKSEGD
jgi:CxxC motif-containing protein